MNETAEMVRLVPHERVQQRTAQVPVESVSLVSQERFEQRTAEVPVEVVSLISQERVQQRTAEAQLTENFPQERISERTQIVDEPVPQILRDFPRSASRSVHTSSICQCRRFFESWSRRNECKTEVCSAQWSVPPGTLSR